MKKNQYTHFLCRCAALLLMMLYAPWALAQDNVTVTGKVTSQDNNSALPGVNVVVKGTTVGTTSGADGNYSISAPAGGTLVFSFIGFVNEEVPIGNRSTIDVGLVPDIKALSEVVVIGYGERERKDLTGAISSVNAQQIQSTPIVSVDQAIQGRISGVQVTNSSGDPTAKPVVRIRGVGTLGNNDPLYVIDGIPIAENRIFNLQSVPNPLALINPADIESIDVLKDASAAAIYGVRAANGVIIITTKRGKQGPAKLTFDSYYGIQQVRKYYDVLGTDEYAPLVREAHTNAGRGLYIRNRPAGSESDEYALEDTFDPDYPGNLLGVNQDWQRPLINNNARVHSYNLGVSGGSENADYSVSGGFFNQEGIFKRRALDRYTLNTNINAKAWKVFRFGLTMKGSYTKEDPVGNGSLNQASTSSPMQTIYDPNQPYGLAIVNPYNTIGPNGQPVGRYPGLPINAMKGNLRQNWLAFNELNENIVHTGRLVTGLYAEVEPIAGLKVRGNLGIDFILSKNESFGRNDTIYGGNFVFTNSLNRGHQERLNLTKEVIASYTKSFGEHSVSLLAGALDQRFDFWGGGQGAIDVPEERELRMPQNGRFATPQTVPGEMFRDYWALQGYIGRLSYNYKGKYYLDATIRRDGSSRFAPENRWGTFPSLAAAWRISDEDFFKTIPFVNNLKLRAGWGQLGNQETRDYAYLSLVTIKPDYAVGVNQTPQSAAAITSFANRALGWETSNQTNIGLDASFLDNKITATVDYYIKQTNDILVGVRLPYVSGVPESAIVNAASVRNSGVELELGYQNAIGDFKYGISGNLTTTRNRVTDLGFSDPINSTNNRTEVGMPMGYFYGYQTNGIIQDEGELDAYNDAVRADSESPNGASPGDIRFVNNNGPAPEGSPRGVYFSGQPDTVITAADRTYLGKAIPDFYYGFNLNGSWKGLDLGIFFQGVSGFQIYNEVRTGSEDMGGYGNSWTTARNRWTGPYTSNSMPRAVNGDPNGNNRFSDRWVENGSFLRLKNIQLGYTLPRGLLTRMGNMSNLRVYVSATNLALITKYSGLDPEILGGDTRQVGSVLEPGVDRGGTPLPRVLTVGLNAAF